MTVAVLVFPANPGIQTNKLLLHDALPFIIQQPKCLVYLPLMNAISQSFKCKNCLYPRINWKNPIYSHFRCNCIISLFITLAGLNLAANTRGDH